MLYAPYAMSFKKIPQAVSRGLWDCLEKATAPRKVERDLGLPKRSAPSSGAGCYGDR